LLLSKIEKKEKNCDSKNQIWNFIISSPCSQF
jgi:hypothetical protein